MKRKNDHFREGSSILVARTSPSSCPIAIMEWFLLAGQHQETDYLLRKIHVCHPKRGFSLHLQPLTYPRDGELFNKCLKTVGLNPKQYGPHSLRFSGALQQPRLLSQTGCSCVIAAGVRSQLRTCTFRKQKKPSLGFPEHSAYKIHLWQLFFSGLCFSEETFFKFIWTKFFAWTSPVLLFCPNQWATTEHDIVFVLFISFTNLLFLCRVQK